MYTPPQKILDNYAKVLVRYALNSGKGIKRGDVVRLTTWESAKPLYVALYREIIKAGGHVLSNYLPDATDRHNTQRDFYEHASKAQLDFSPTSYFQSLVDLVDHEILIIAEADKHSLTGVDPKKIMRRGEAMKPYMEARTEKENQGKLTWTLALYGTEAAAKEAGLSLKAYWNQIIKACFLHSDDPIKEWKRVTKAQTKVKHWLNSLPIEKLHIEGAGTNLWITLGEKRAFIGGSGRNIPSFELFTSPDARGTEGFVSFDLPLYRYGTLITDVYLEFKNGRVVKAKASQGEQVLQAMITTPGAARVGEFSLTDKRFSNISRFMAETLFDENFGGKAGNMHLALGKSYVDTYAGDIAAVNAEDWEELGYNDSSVHTDIVQTTDRTVTAHLKDGRELVIYRQGQFTNF